MHENARKYESLILQRLAKVGQSACATAMDVSESTVSRLQSEQLPKIAILLETLELKVVPVDTKCYRPEDIEPYILIAKQHMASIKGAESLEYRGEE